jgi:RNA polymerase sigma factor (sigma-70 family)
VRQSIARESGCKIPPASSGILLAMTDAPTRQLSDDGSLLGAFSDAHDERAFEEVVRRHASLVQGVCRRVLGHHVDADDATQAVFYTLARKAAALRSERCVAAWLHHVARCAARTARDAAATRAKREREAAADPTSSASSPMMRAELRERLDQELSALPKRYRVPLVLFHLEQRSLADTAQILGRPVGTIGACLSRGRELLRDRFERRGMHVDALALTALLAAESMPTAADVSTLSHQAISVAAPATVALSNGALHMIFLAKLKTAAAIFAISALFLLIGGGVAHVGAADPGADGKESPAAEIARYRSELEQLRRDSITFAELERCGVLDVAHEIADSSFIFDDTGMVDENAVAFFHLTDGEKRDLELILHDAHEALAAAFKRAGARMRARETSVPDPALAKTIPGGGIIVELPALSDEGRDIQAAARERLLAVLGEHRGSLCWHILGRYWDDAFLGFGIHAQDLTVTPKGAQFEVKHNCKQGSWTRLSNALPWKYSLFAAYLPEVAAPVSPTGNTGF